MSLFDFIVESGLKTVFSPFTAVAKVVDDALDTPHKDRWDTFVDSRPGVDLNPPIVNLDGLKKK